MIYMRVGIFQEELSFRVLHRSRFFPRHFPWKNVKAKRKEEEDEAKRKDLLLLSCEFQGNPYPMPSSPPVK